MYLKVHIMYKKFYKGSRGSIKVRVPNRCIFSMFATKCFQQDISCSMQALQQTSFKVVRNNFVELLSLGNELKRRVDKYKFDN